MEVVVIVDVSVIVVTYNSSAYISRCIDSIYRETKDASFEVIVVDNASSDDTVKLVSEKYPDVRVIQNDENNGFGAANNQGAKGAQGNFLLFLNPDTKLITNAISIFLSFCNLQSAFCIGGQLINQSGNSVVSYGNFPSVFQQISDLGFRKIYPKYFRRKLATGCVVDFSEPREVDYVSGANLFVKKEVFDLVGGFDEEYFMYYEEVDLCKKLSVVSCQLSVVPSAKIIHYESLSTSKNLGFNYQKYGMLEKSKYRYFRKQYGLWIVGFLKLLQVMTLALHTPFSNQKFWKSTKITIKA